MTESGVIRVTVLNRFLRLDGTVERPTEYGLIVMKIPHSDLKGTIDPSKSISSIFFSLTLANYLVCYILTNISESTLKRPLDSLLNSSKQLQ